ncbi:MAG: dehydratase, partial [Chloroflexota bacterium]
QMGWVEGTTVALLEVTFRVKGPVKFGDTVRLVIKVKEKKETSKPDRGILITEANILNQRDETVIEGQWTTMMRRKAA